MGGHDTASGIEDLCNKLMAGGAESGTGVFSPFRTPAWVQRPSDPAPLAQDGTPATPPPTTSCAGRPSALPVAPAAAATAIDEPDAAHPRPPHRRRHALSRRDAATLVDRAPAARAVARRMRYGRGRRGRRPAAASAPSPLRHTTAHGRCCELPPLPRHGGTAPCLMVTV